MFLASSEDRHKSSLFNPSYKAYMMSGRGLFGRTKSSKSLKISKKSSKSSKGAGRGAAGRRTFGRGGGGRNFGGRGSAVVVRQTTNAAFSLTKTIKRSKQQTITKMATGKATCKMPVGITCKNAKKIGGS